MKTIQDLIALACGSHSEEESRTSALAACKAIQRHGVRLSLPPVPEAPFPRFASTPPRRPEPAPSKPEPRKPEPAKKEPFRGYRSGTKMYNGKGYDDAGKKPVAVLCKYEAFCQGCGVGCEVGARIWWRKGVGIACMACGPQKLKSVDVEV